MENIIVRVAKEDDSKYSQEIVDEMASSAKARGTGIAKRTPEYVSGKMKEGKGVIALTEGGQWVGFCYIESWGNKEYVANSGLIVVEKFRKHHLAQRIKQTAFTLSRLRWPNAKLFGLTSQTAVMRINTKLGYVPVAFSELTQDDAYWAGCGTPEHPCCVNCDVLARSNRKYCVCTAMLYDPKEHVGEPLPVQLPDDVVKMAQEAAAHNLR